MSKVFINVINPKGIEIEIDESRWLELSKKGYRKVGTTYTHPNVTEDTEFLEVEEV